MVREVSGWFRLGRSQWVVGEESVDDGGRISRWWGKSQYMVGEESVDGEGGVNGWWGRSQRTAY